MVKGKLTTKFLVAVLFAAVCLEIAQTTLWQGRQTLPPPLNRPFPPPPPPNWQAHLRPHTPTRVPRPPRVWPVPLTLNLVTPGYWGTYNGTLFQAVSPEEVIRITALHNQLRATLAAGELPRFPSATDMLQMEYDGEVARRAQLHSQSCRFQHGCFGCGNVHGFIGQNLFMAPRGSWEQAIMTWWDEYRLTSPSIVRHYNFSPNNGHFTQMAWARNAKVGCGATDCPQLGGRYMVCNYEPGGNVIGQPVYREGWPCSQCPEGTRCVSEQGDQSKPSLCGKAVPGFPPRPVTPWDRLATNSTNTTGTPA
ncbi:scoloptoxin SSD976-like [Haemaphysalis longicornis]